MKSLLSVIAAAAHLHASEIRMEMVGGGYVFKVDKASGSIVVAVDQPDAVPMLGSVAIQGQDLLFTPRFPLIPGLKYRASYKPKTGASQTTVFEIQKPFVAPTTVVEHIFPSTDSLPENQLKIYVHFSAPMRKGDAYQRVRLLDDKGKKVELAFLELDEELWDRDGKRLTLLFDPGRIKRGVLPLAEVGGALKPGERYKVVVDSSWPDAAGNPLVKGFEKSFKAVQADRVSPDIAAWKVTAPAAGSGQPLTLKFSEPLDEALLNRMIAVKNSQKTVMKGSVKIDQDETRWHFQPTAIWLAGQYFLEIDTALEDLAGNKIGKLFDVDVFEKIDTTLRTPKVTIPFTVK